MAGDAFSTVMDVMPTILDLAGVAHPGTHYKNQPVAPTQGKSMLPYLRRETETVHSADEAIGWELFGRFAIRRGMWKAVQIPPPNGLGAWQLYDLAHDPGETDDLAARYPEELSALLALWEDYVAKSGTILDPGSAPVALD